MAPVPDSPIRDFIQASKDKGASDEAIAAILTRQGWSEDDVYQALGTYWSETTGVPVPLRTRTRESSREAFLYLLAFSTLCGWATALGSALFTYINHWFPEPVEINYAYASFSKSVTKEMATMFVTLPIFLLVMRAIIRESSSNPEQLQSGVRKWLTYIALLGTAGTMIGDLIWFMTYLLQGEITTRFFLKSAVVLVICGAIFLYYLRFLQSPEKRTSFTDQAWNRAFTWGSLASVICVFGLGFIIDGTPSQYRDRRTDNQRLRDLQFIANVLQANSRPIANQPPAPLPEDLKQLVDRKLITHARIQDPVSKENYRYVRMGDSKYQLCATFATSNIDNEDRMESAFWKHSAGETCFEIDALQNAPY